MGDVPPYRDSDDTGAGADGAPAAGTPLWVKVFGVTILILVMIVVIVLVTGAGGHGPGSHVP